MTRASISRRALLPLGLSLALALSCSDSPDAGIVAGPARQAYLTTQQLEADIDALIEQFFSGGDRSAVKARWANVKRQDVKNQSGRKQYVQLADWIIRKAPALNAPAGETGEHAATRLVLLMSAYVYGLDLNQIPEIGLSTDATVEIIQPNEADTVITPSIRAAAIFPVGAVSEQTVIVISKLDQVFGPCSGPLDTPRCQYPDFYKFSSFPEDKFGVAVTVKVCRSVHAANHDNFRLAHELPAPANRHPQGIVDGNIEILPPVNASGLIECEEEDEEHEVPITTHGARTPIGRAGAALASAARKTLGFFAPRPLYARRIDRGAGGELMDFSHVVTVDPQSGVPTDLEVAFPPTAGFSVTPNPYVYPNDTVTTSSWLVKNTGSSTVTGVGVTIIVATDSALTNVVWESGTSVIPSIGPGQTSPVGAFTFSFPANATYGAYFIGGRIDKANTVVETNEGNNYISARRWYPNPVQ